jgi:periplasmic protein TonB
MIKILIFLFVFFSSHIILGQSSIKPIDYEIVEVKPQFLGGINEFMKFVISNFEVPEVEGGIAGVLKMSIVIDINGNVKDIKVLKDIGDGSEGAGLEAIRVLSKCSKWIPGQQSGKNVPVIYNFPINIKSL